MKSAILILTAVVLCSSGCAKNRWLSRRDYSEMQDPFTAEGEAIVAEAEGESGGLLGRRKPAETGSSGRARLNTMADDSSDEPMRGPKPIQPASNVRNPGGASGVATADYPNERGAANEAAGARSYCGPELSDFLQGRSDASTPADSAADPRSAARNNLTMPRINRDNRAPQRPVLSAEAEGFSDFLNDGTASAAGMMKKGQTIAAEAEAESEGFEDWATQQQADWSNEAKAMRASAGSMPSEFEADMKATARSVQKTARDAVPHFDAPAEFDEVDETAEPLIARPTATAKQIATDVKASARQSANSMRRAAESEVNPFENPFADEPAPTASAAPKYSAGNRKSSSPAPTTSDDGLFSNDTGWKPAHLTRP